MYTCFREDDGETSNIAVMLELARATSQSSQGFGNAVIFFFNTGEEEGLSGSHSFITQVWIIFFFFH